MFRTPYTVHYAVSTGTNSVIRCYELDEVTFEGFGYI